MKELNKKVAIITGGSRGIGKACCLSFAEAGAQIIFTYNKGKAEAEQLEQELQAKGVTCIAMQLDVRDYAQCHKVIETALEKFKRLDILVNNAGIIRDKSLLMMLAEDWKEVIDTDLGGVFNMSKAAITTFLKQKSGCIINMSSISGIVGIPRQTNYSAAKAGIIGFTKALSKEVAHYNIRVNAVCPGFIGTDMVNGLREEIKKELLEMIPMKRFGQAQEVSQVCVFLASDKARYITGEAIRVSAAWAYSGGLMAKKIDFESVKKEVKQLVSDISEVPLGDLKDDARFAEDLGVDSMMALEIIASLEKKYKVVIPEEKIPTVRSLSNVYELLEGLLRK